ncbi:diguanylate cyclase (GGDEF)-like protein [Catenulispora sp. GP43]|uniref:GTP cyclohydrolase IIa n=1 Tax=Catenulispora sp. GP43 TaxID=3156263 RepID=UPI0035159780
MPAFAAVLLPAALAASGGYAAGWAALRRRFRHAVAETAQARWLADHDTLTGLPNRTTALRRHQQAVAAGRPVAVALVDLNNFKAVNDTWGHQAGDTQLAAVADRLAAAGRKIGALACRLGGDEFVLLLPAADPRTLMHQVSEISATVSAALPLAVEENLTVITHPGASVGVAVPEPDDSFSDLLRKADLALYHAKSRGTGTHLYAPGLRQPPSHRGTTIAAS